MRAPTSDDIALDDGHPLDRHLHTQVPPRHLPVTERERGGLRKERIVTRKKRAVLRKDRRVV